ncbi:hypothetical protein PybrP1_012556 [[Pythium] brassicae (nom. inval.)]|nr:hypothetical protein PybrP1_012556 [[Pythium] brassicae (nom. inval.)]
MGLLGCLGGRRRRESKSESLEAEYELLQLLGEGKTGQVVLARHRRSRAEVAVKLVSTAYLDTPARQQALRSEIDILRRVRHPGVLKLFAVFHENDRVAVVTERARGGELMPALCAGGALGERDIARIRMSVGAKQMNGMNGTCHYMAPEMFGRESAYGCEIDMWALGVVTFILLFGRFPFDGRFLSQVEDKIAARDFAFPADLAPLVSREATKFIEYLLVVNPRERPPAAMALQHPWLRANSDSMPNAPFSAYHMTQLRQFVDGRKELT